MTHDPYHNGHDPDHHHNRGRNRHHDHDHDHDSGSEPGFEEKVTALLRHWIAHNDSHGRNYYAWAEKAESHNHKDAARFLKEAGNLSDRITGELESALKKLTQ